VKRRAMVIVDSSIWIDYFNDVKNLWTDWLDFQADLQPIGLTDLIFCEVLQGMIREPDWIAVEKHLRFYDIGNTGGAQMATASARNFVRLRRRGLTVRKTIDCIIATYCIQNSFELLHNDRDFDSFEHHLGLKVVQLQ
jgi:predicted nucleic acid-binding protein